jgi:4-amino-4-deoxy-L-arabinose transferase-like glycosyltransferase
LAAYAGLIVVALVLVASTLRVFSPVVDEPAHIAAGYQWWHGDPAFDPPHPPLARLIEAWPLRNITTPPPTDLVPHGQAILNSGGETVRHLARARTGNLLFLALALAGTIGWGLRFGRGVALLAAAMLAALPPILGHAGLATTDLAVTALLPLALLALDRWLRERTITNALILGMAVGLGVLTKFSFLIFLPACVLALLVIRRPAIQLSRTFAGLLIVAVVAFFVVWTGYRFTFGVPRLWPGLHVPAPALIDGLTVLQRHNNLGHDSYLFGSVRRFGWWYYFPAVFFFKTPLPFLLLVAIGTAVIIWRCPAHLDFVLMPLALMLSVLPATINIGVRHILPLYPTLCVVAAIGVREVWRSTRMRVIVALACAWLFAGVALAYPDYMAWFNEAAGRHPEQIAVDSNLDWGQDILRLRQVERRRHIDHIFLNCLNEETLNEHETPLPPSQPAHGWVAVSETPLHVDPYARAGAYDWLKPYTPVERVGKSIRLYYVP